MSASKSCGLFLSLRRSTEISVFIRYVSHAFMPSSLRARIEKVPNAQFPPYPPHSAQTPSMCM
jgi:hypothetical protein